MVRSMALQMLERPEHLPDYKDPPIDEVALSIQFGELGSLSTVGMGQLCAAFSDQFPIIEEKPQIQPKFETFGDGLVHSTLPNIEISQLPNLRRIWLVSEDGHELLQIQTNRFVHNWRKIKGEGHYPRFESILPKYLAEIETLKSELARIGLPELEINQCELSYFNNIDLRDDEGYSEGFERVFRNWGSWPSGVPKSGIKTEPDVPVLGMKLKILSKDSDQPFARLHVDAIPAVKSGGERMIRLNLVFRGLPNLEVDNFIEQFMAQGREVIVQQFQALASDAANELWGHIK